jgi:hypothetical protein
MGADADREDDVVPEDVEKEARHMGWVPEDEFKGNKDHWVDASEFVERGRTVMPILLQNNRRLQKELSTRDEKIDTLEARLQNSEKVMEKLEKHYTEANKRAVVLAKDQLREELKQAREDNDIDRELTINDQLADLRKREDAIEDPPVKKDTPTPKSNGETPEFKEWNSRNPWFGKDKNKTKLVSRIAEDLREEGTDLTGTEFLDECVRLYDEQYGDKEDDDTPVRRTNGKVEATPQRRTPRSGGKSYADLPSDAKAQCREDADDLVGPDKRYKSMKDWEAAYAKIYFAE